MYDRDLRRLFSDSPEFAGQPAGSAVLRRMRPELREVVAHWTGAHQYTVDQVLQEMIARCRELKLRMHRSERATKRDAMILLSIHTMNYLHAGHHRLGAMKKLRVLVLMHEDLVPPESIKGLSDKEIAPYKSEYDVSTGLQNLGHEVRPLGLSSDLGVLRDAIIEWQPDIMFNLPRRVSRCGRVRSARRRLPGADAQTVHRLQSARAAAGTR